jgi:hypothetical protein
MCFLDEPEEWISRIVFAASLSLSRCLSVSIMFTADRSCGLFFHFRQGYVFAVQFFDVMKYWPILEARWIWNWIAIELLIHDNVPRGKLRQVPSENFYRMKHGSGTYEHGLNVPDRMVAPGSAQHRLSATCYAIRTYTETCCYNSVITSWKGLNILCRYRRVLL